MKTLVQKCVVGMLLSLSAWAAVAADSQSPAAAFDYFANNWNVIGLKDYPRGARVTPDNRILMGGRDTAVQVRFGRKLAPLTREHGKLALEGWMPVMVIGAEDGPVRYEFTCWATPMPGLKDWKAAFDWPTEGENFLVWVQAQATNTGAAPAEARVEIALDYTTTSLPKTGAATKNGSVANQPIESTRTPGLSLARTLAPGETAEDAARFTFFPVRETAPLQSEDYRVWLQRTIDYWKGLERSVANITVPCRKATEALKAAHVCQMIANDRGEVRGGEGFYDQFYIRDGAYQVMELEEAGMWDAARKSVELYLPRQRPDGRFESQRGQFDANGQAVWVLWNYYQMTADRAWLERVYPAMRRAADWTSQARRQAPADSPYAGLLPNALADGENLWDGKHHIVGYDFWNLRGLLCTAEAARTLGKAAEAAELEKEASDYRQAIETAWKRTGLAWFPPSWEKTGTHWGDTETLWPTAIFPRHDPRVAALIDQVRRDFGGGFVEGTIRWLGRPEVIHPYMGAYTTMADLVRGNHEQVVEDFYWYLLHSTAAHAFPEGIYYQRRYAWSETIPHVTGACNYAIMLRHMLVHEEGNELHLLKAVPDGWLEEGQEICIERLPTWFGEIGLRIRCTKHGVQVALDPPRRKAPARIVLHLPANRPLESPVRGVAVETRSAQSEKWDFDMVVKRYEDNRNLASKPVAFPGPTPGPAHAQRAGDRIILENNVLHATWDLSGGHLALAGFTNRLTSTTLDGQGRDAIQAATTEKPNMRLIPTGPPALERLTPNPQSVRLADRAAGWRVRVPLASEGSKLRLDWQAVLRDDANYVRIEANPVAPQGSPIQKLTLLDAAAPQAQVLGEVDGSPVVAGGIFAAVEHPMAANRVDSGRIVCSLGPLFSHADSSPSLPPSAVLGVTPAGQLRRAFLCYLEHERARPYAPFLHYNSWYDIAWSGLKMNEKVCREAVEVFGRELTQRRGVALDSFVFDDGWDDNRTLWKFHADFPQGFAPVSAAARKYQGAVGAWLSPWGGYGQAKAERLQFGRAAGFETNAKGFSLAGPRYYQNFRDVCLGMIRDYGMNYFKFDGIAQGNSSAGSGQYASDVDALLRLIGDLRRERPNLFINVTVGTWPSPFWLRFADSTWRSHGDMGFQGQGSTRQQWINYRDGITYQWIVRRAPLYPISSLMTQGICYSQWGSAAKFSTDIKEFRDEVRSFFASGTQLQELYLRPQLLTPAMWDALAEGASWSRKNADVLSDVHWIGGDPAKGEVYGWGAWSPRQGMIALRNPSPEPGRISIDIAKALELPAGAPQRYRLQNPFAEDKAAPIKPVSGGTPRVFDLAPFEVLVLDTIPMDKEPQ